MDDFCGSTFWNTTLTWKTDNPDFTPCFEKTVLVWIPCIYLWVAAVIEVYQMVINKEANIPWNKYNISKLVVTLLLTVLQVIDISQIIYISYREQNKMFNADYYDPAIKLVTFVLSAILVAYNRYNGRRTSGVLFLFWLLLILAGLPQLRTEMRNYNAVEDDYVRYNFASYIVYYFLVIVMFILNSFADLPPRNTPYIYQEIHSPERSSGFLYKLTFSWFDTLAITGYRRTLTENDMWPLNPQDVSKESVAKFEKHWFSALRKRYAIPNPSDTSETSPMQSRETKNKPISLVLIVWKSFGGMFAVGMVLKLCNDLLVFVAPALLRLLIGFVEGDEPLWRGYLYAVGLLVCNIVQTVFLTQHYWTTQIVGMRIHSALCSMVYKKALSLSNEARKKFTAGEVINLISTDVTRFTYLQFVNLIWAAPLQITLALYFLWVQLGPSILAGIAVIVILMPINGLFAQLQEKLQNELMQHKDQRIKLMNEILNGIKVLKLYAWEPSFQQYILEIRNKEVNILKRIAMYYSIYTFVWFCTPFLVSLMSFMCFVLVNDTEVLDAKKAFVALSLFNILRFPMTMLPNVISDIIQMRVSLKRLNNFLNSEELDTFMIEHNSSETDQILVEDCTFSWGGEGSEPILKNLSVHIPRGSLVAVVGAVGAGKSSLLSALLGEMDKLSGRVNVKGSIAYVAQTAWIQNASVQNNILFANPLNKNKYNEIIEACALKADLAIFPAGDQTEIGEKGINLSGGQKQRVALARAVYCAADNYLLDDPLSAVDSHVGKHIFDQVMGPTGLLKNKTRIWVTHNISYLAQTDLVVVLRNGEVSEVGSYQELIDRNGAFADFLQHHMSIVKQHSDENAEKQGTKSEVDIQARKLKWARSLSSDGTLSGNLDENVEHNDLDPLIEAERPETGSVKWEVYKHYLTNIGIYISIATVVVYILMRSFQVGANFWIARWTSDDNMIVNGSVNTQLRNMYLGVYSGFGLAEAITSFFANWLPYYGCWKATKVLHNKLLYNVLRTPLQFFEVTPVGRIMSRFSKDVDSLDNDFGWRIASALDCFFEVLGIMFVISYTTPLFMAVIIPISLIYYAIQRFYIPTTRQLLRMESASRSPIFSHLNESILGATSIRAFGVKDRFVTESQEKVDYFQSFAYLISIADRWLGVRLQVVGSLIIFFAALFAVLGRESISPGFVGLSITYTLDVTQTLSWFVEMVSSIETDMVAVERMKEYTETEQEADWEKSPGPRPSWPETGSVQLEGLVMSYRAGHEPALRAVTCTVAPRDKLGIVGRTGAGKSTLTLGLFRIVEAAGGRVLIDGLDISTIGLHQLRERITIIPQDPVLFSGSLRMNLDPFKSYSDDQIWSAIEHAHLKPFVLGLQAGLLHCVSEGGENLSVGQRQLVCLARALLRKTPLLVLDEATAAVDLETDELIQRTIRAEFADCTVITIAHRLNTIMDSTNVMVLDKGQLVEYAPPQLLLQDSSSMFYSLAKDAGLVS